MSTGQEGTATPRYAALGLPALIEWAQSSLASAVRGMLEVSAVRQEPFASNLSTRGVRAAWWSLADGRPGSDPTSNVASGLAYRSWLDERRLGDVRDVARQLDHYYGALVSGLAARAVARSGHVWAPTGDGKTLLALQLTLDGLLKSARQIDELVMRAEDNNGNRIVLVLQRGHLVIKDEVDALAAFARACAATLIRALLRALRLMRALLRPHKPPGRTPTYTCTHRIPPLTGAVTRTAPPSAA